LTPAILVHASVAALCLVAVSPALAGSISITMELTATPRGGALAVSLKITNSGDEAAETVVAGGRFVGHDVRAPARPKLSPGESMQATLDIPWAPATPGQWPLTTTVDYADRNGYAFQAVQVALVSAASATPALVAVLRVAAGQIASGGRVLFRIKSLSELTRQARVQVVVPRGLEVDQPVRSLEIGPWADAEISANILNRAAVAGSRYPVFVTVEYDDRSGHHAALGSAVVEIVPARKRSASYAWIAVAVLLIVWVGVLAYRRSDRARLSGAASRDAY